MSRKQVTCVCCTERHDMLREVGRVVALLHDGGMVHGDLTTSNMLLRGNSSLVRHLLVPEFLMHWT